ncbi:MAG: hypothetical protein JSW67_13355 [Candidatus Latescibacterota bacterium]|nr:MAG: hypothetical protein JSW67_13355 [Candidatus Latescibacterota bacterium]
MQLETGRLRLVVVAALVALPTCSGEEEEPAPEVLLAPGIALQCPAGWSLHAAEAGGYEVERPAPHRIEKINAMLLPGTELVAQAGAPVRQETGKMVATRYRESVLANSKLPALYKSFFEGYEFYDFKILTHASKTWGVYTQRRIGRKTQFWTNLFTWHGENLIVVAAQYDGNDVGQGVGPEAWPEYLSLFVWR